MPFRDGYTGVYDAATLAKLQGIFEYVWQEMIDGRAPIFDRDDLARLIIKAHDSGMDAETIKAVLTTEAGTAP
jgi:hypothetical protein